MTHLDALAPSEAAPTSTAARPRRATWPLPRNEGGAARASERAADADRPASASEFLRVVGRDAPAPVAAHPARPGLVDKPLDLSLNDGLFAPAAAIAALARFSQRTSLRAYTSADNAPLRRAIAHHHGVSADQVFLHNGTGPILKLAIPHLVRERILRSPTKLVRHLLRLESFPLYTPQFTYSKVPRKAVESGLKVHTFPMSPEAGFALDVDALRRLLSRRAGIVYIANPNNPTGNVLLRAPELEALLRAYPDTAFWIDEAYLEYVDPAEHAGVGALTARYPNLFVSRSFSFAWGMAGLRIGYLLAPAPFVAQLEKKVTEYRLGAVQEAVAIAALGDREHLPYVREVCARGRTQLTRGLEAFPGIEVFPSQVNFLLCRFTDGRTGSWLAGELARRGILIKTFASHNGHDFAAYFRVTLGLPEENARFLEVLPEVLEQGPVPFFV